MSNPILNEHKRPPLVPVGVRNLLGSLLRGSDVWAISHHSEIAPLLAVVLLHEHVPFHCAPPGSGTSPVAISVPRIGNPIFR